MQIPRLLHIGENNTQTKLKPKTSSDYREKYEDCLAYIDNYWKKIIRKPQKQKINHNFLKIPHHFITPNDKKFSYIFYWDSFFIFRGLMGTKKEWAMKEMIENFVYLFDKYGIIPNFNSHASVGRSQPPFLTSMILDVYKTFNNGNHSRSKMRAVGDLILKPASTFGHLKWLRDRMEIARKEYDRVWNNSDLYNHFVDKYGLNRYGDRDIGYAHSSELESGWDFTSRFYNRCNEFLPIDLNSYLYKYEKDFELTANILDDNKAEIFWEEKAEKRKKTINKTMWNEDEGFFFDFNYKYKRQSDFLSLAGFVPMYEGIATFEQAKEMVRKLKSFETDFGLTVTSESSLSPKINLTKIPIRYRPAIIEVVKPKQWDYPNIWPPLEYLTVIGLLRYGFTEDAKRIMKKSLDAHAKVFRENGTFFERIDGILGDKPSNDFHYSMQSGFGWTNAIFYRYVRLLEKLESGEDIYVFGETLHNPPYELAILN
ncbi:MAG: trehalase family glycosidase [Patescibacteria group bacterium]